MDLFRRDFVRLAIVALGGSGLLGRSGRVYALAQATENRGQVAASCGFFNPAQVRTLEAMVDRIIPPGGGFAGGKDAGVISFIDRALCNWAPQNRWDYVAGLEAIDESSQIMSGGKFADLTEVDQTRVLEAMEKGEAPGQTWERLQIGAGESVPRVRTGNEPLEKSSQSFFTLVINHAMQGYYGDPKYGGNKDKLSWKMIGYIGYTHR
jgi:gluconate 2-dehydrogenase gamma chain